MLKQRKKHQKNKHITTSIHLGNIYIYIIDMNIYACKKKKTHTQKELLRK